MVVFSSFGARQSFEMVLCPRCRKGFSQAAYDLHVFTHHHEIHDTDLLPFTIKHSWYKHAFRVYERYFCGKERAEMKTLDLFVDRMNVEVAKVFDEFRYPCLSNMTVNVTMCKVNSLSGETDYIDLNLVGKQIHCFDERYKSEFKDQVISDIADKFETRTNSTSGLTLFSFNFVKISTTIKIDRKLFGCELENEGLLPAWVRCNLLPTTRWNGEVIREKNRCFLRSLNSARAPRKTGRNRIDFNTVKGYKNLPSFPVDVDSMVAFAKENKIKLHLYGYTHIDQQFYRDARKVLDIAEDGIVYPIYNDPDVGARDAVYLLLFENHVMPIRDPLRMMRPKLFIDNSGRNTNVFCPRCGCIFHYADERNEHYQKCLKEDRSHRLIFSTDNYYKPNRRQNTEIRSFVGYMDTEACLRPIINSRNEAEHELAAYGGVLMKCGKKPKLVDHEFFAGADAGEKAADLAMKWVEYFAENTKVELKCDEVLRPILKMIAEKCEICEVPFANDGEKYFHHLHSDTEVQNVGGYEHNVYKVVCNSCNLARKTDTTLKIMFVNLSYDILHLLKHFVNHPKLAHISPTVHWCSQNKLTFVKFKDVLELVCTTKYFNVGVASMGNRLTDADMEIFSTIPCIGSKYPLLRQKLAFPYKLMDTLDYLNTTVFPPIEDFFNDLKDEPMDQETYDRSRQLFDAVGNMERYLELYCLADVCIEAAYMSKMQYILYARMGHDPFSCYSMPAFAQLVASLKDGVRIGLIDDQLIYDEFSANSNGGQSTTLSLRGHRANNPSVKGYNREKRRSYLLYLDIIALYGSVLTRCPLPISRPIPISEADLELITLEYVKNADVCGEMGLVLRVDIQYTPECQDRLFECPPLVHRHVVSEADMTEFMKGEFAKSNSKIPRGTERLVNSFVAQKGILLHLAYVQFLLSLGVTVTIRGGYTFAQRVLYRDFGALCEKYRNEDPENKDLWKLCLNALYGKSLQSRVYSEIELVRNFDDFVHVQAKSDIKRVLPIVDELSFVEKQRKYSFKINPIHVGKSVLDWAKTHFFSMVQAVFARLRAKGWKVTTVYTDTDSIQLIVSEETIVEEEDCRLTQDQVYGAIADHRGSHGHFQLPSRQPSLLPGQQGKIRLVQERSGGQDSARNYRFITQGVLLGRGGG